MLRDFKYEPEMGLVLDVLSRFEIKDPKNLAIMEFEALSPDSFIWRLCLNDSFYYLYAEDYVPGLKHVQDFFNHYIENTKWSFVEPEKTLLFEEASPVQGAGIYQKAEDANEMMKYAVDSGHDFVFLVKSEENPDDYL